MGRCPSGVADLPRPPGAGASPTASRHQPPLPPRRRGGGGPPEGLLPFPAAHPKGGDGCARGSFRSGRQAPPLQGSASFPPAMRSGGLLPKSGPRRAWYELKTGRGLKSWGAPVAIGCPPTRERHRVQASGWQCLRGGGAYVGRSIGERVEPPGKTIMRC